MNELKAYTISHLVKSEDLNHHGTLFAGRTAEWLVEAGFITAAGCYGKPEEILCVNLHGFVFSKPVQKGDILTVTGRIVRAGGSSFMVHVKAESEIDRTQNVEGLISFVCVDSETRKPKKHGMVLGEPENEDVARLRAEAEIVANEWKMIKKSGRI